MSGVDDPAAPCDEPAHAPSRRRPRRPLRAALIDPARRERTRARCARRLRGAVDDLRHHRQRQPGPAFRHDRADRLVARSCLGYLKHPPLAAWHRAALVQRVSGRRVVLLPAGDADADDRAVVAWRLSADYLDVEKRVVGLALLTLIPFFNFHALKFNVNTVLMPLWAATTFWFLRSYRDAQPRSMPRSPASAPPPACWANTGRCSCSPGLVVAALIDPRRGAYFRSAAPWITVAVGAGRARAASRLAGAARLRAVRLCRSAFTAPSRSSTPCQPRSAISPARVGYVAIPVIIVLAAARPSRAALADMVWPARRRAPAGGGGVLGAVAAAGARRAGERHRDHLAVVDAGLDAAAGAAAVVAGGDDRRRSTRAAFCSPRWRCRWSC